LYQHSISSASGFDAPERGPFPKFAGDELDDFLFAKALEYFGNGWSLSDVQEWVSDWHILTAAIGAVLSDDDVQAIVARAERVGPIACEANNVISLDSRLGAPGPTSEGW
jgi:hypothetical protein